MKLVWFLLAIFGIVIIAYPEFLAYLIWGFFLLVWLNIILINTAFNFMKKWNMASGKKEFFSFGKYKIYK